MQQIGSSGAADRTGGSAQSGFTLIELLVSLAVLALISALLLAALSASRGALERVEQKGQEADIEAVQQLLRELLTQARPPRQQNQSDRAESANDFVGASDNLRFRTGHAARGQYGGIYGVEIKRISQGSSAMPDALLLVQRISREQERVREPASLPAVETLLLNGIRAFEVRYFGSKSAGDAPQWHPSWMSDTHLPKLVAIELELEPRRNRRWPALIIPIVLAR